MKRFIDILVASVLLVLLAGPLLLLYSIVRLTLGKPALFHQTRIGRHGKPFKLIKFRTMTGEFGPDGILLPDVHRLTRLGSFLRSTSLDELPELINVLRGEMSLVGPRPLILDYLPLYNSHQARRHEVLPGITGWAQINGRNSLSWQEKFQLDIWYVDHSSIILDIRILILTVVKVISMQGVNSSSDCPMPEFTGNN